MANLKEVRTRIESVNSTKQITSAMKMVAASKLRKSQNAIMALRPYAEKFSEILERINGQQTTVNSQQSTTSRVLIIPLSSNKGLCGVFNANVIRETINLIKNEYQTLLDNNGVDILCVGSKV
ncbi:MAG: F0F1 ATP synthase subunit gamma, partial [Bacteroidales bacterium]|nr:F0F1 ATP synthase subunit gamma [Bacteroidales bacterium]